MSDGKLPKLDTVDAVAQWVEQVMDDPGCENYRDVRSIHADAVAHLARAVRALQEVERGLRNADAEIKARPESLTPAMMAIHSALTAVLMLTNSRAATNE